MKAYYDGQYYWADDLADHGGSRYKVFTQSKSGLNWFRDADMFGNFIEGKHKGAIEMRLMIR